MLSRTLLMTAMAVLLAACSSADQSRVSGTGFDPQGGDIVDTAGTFRYSFKKDERCNGNCDQFQRYEICAVDKSFSSRRPYCQALRDSGLNGGCALAERRALYLKDCAPNFEEINLGGLSGGSSMNPHTGKACDYKLPDSPTLTVFCAMLKDEKVANYCQWDYRRILFKQHSCPGQFSELPEPYATLDEGTIDLSMAYSYLNQPEATYKRRTIAYRIQPNKPAVLSFSNFWMNEQTCERKGLLSLRGILRDLKNNTETEFNPRTAKLALTKEGWYTAVVEVQNPGLCKQADVRYNANLELYY